ncbi:sensor histidine kinase [Embleya scabrispora]|uniref:sensor histidine kinase n=1 Tax=Embleya scabrispora TaxID=159449 RepID=UPI0003A61751|nr:ATP-binding protein [Embleya scabrispora]MYS84016.1 histidine kinase [Streptomyces sp. SID5474]
MPMSNREQRSGLDRAYAVCGASLVGGLITLVLLLTHLDDPRMSPRPALIGVSTLQGIAFALSGLFVISRRSAPGLGWLLLWTGLAYPLSSAVLFSAVFADAGPVWAGVAIALWLVADAVFLFGMYALPLWLPNGSLPRARFVRIYAVLVALWSALHAYNDYAGSDWHGLPSFLRHGAWAVGQRWLDGWLTPRLDLIPPLVILTSLGVMTVCWVRSPRPRPMRLVPLLPYLLWLAVSFLGYHLELSDLLYEFLLYAGVLVWQLCFAYAFARDRQWHLDRSARKVLAAFSLAAVLMGGYFGIAVALSGVLPGARTTGALVMAAGALVIGALLRPTVGWAMRVVDRFYYGERARPYQVVRDLSEQLSRAPAPGAAPTLLCRTVVHTLGLPGAGVVVDTRHGERELARIGDAGADRVDFPLTYEGVVIGRLSAPPRPGQDTLDRQDLEVLRFLADQAAPAIASLRLYEELQETREHIVLAREEARRRLRHDLHDGLGPALSGTRLQVDTARACVPPGTPAEGTLAIASRSIGEAITELRRITDGLAPAALARLGLADALRECAGRLDGGGGTHPRIRVAFDPDPPPPLPAAVEVAVYRICGEALTNVVRHARARNATLDVRVTDTRVVLEVADDGVGNRERERGAATEGVGLASMAERAEELGGTFTAGGDEHGTVVRAVIPRPGTDSRDQSGTDPGP